MKKYPSIDLELASVAIGKAKEIVKEMDLVFLRIDNPFYSLGLLRAKVDQLTEILK